MCSNPNCQRGYALDPRECRCYEVNPPASTCPTGYRAVNMGGSCTCQRERNPICRSGFSLTSSCQCSINVQPSCPHGSSPASPAKCTTNPTCSQGQLRNCKCIETTETTNPRCSSGRTLSSNGCTCEGPAILTHPTCTGTGCSLTSSCNCFGYHNIIVSMFWNVLKCTYISNFFCSCLLQCKKL